MSDTPEVPDVQVPEESFKVAIVDEVVPADATAELEAKNAELEARIAELSAAPPAPAPAVEAHNPGFSELAAELRKMQEPKEAPKPVDYNQIIEETSKNFYGDPTKSVLNLLTPVVQELKTESDAKLNTQAKQISKLTVLAQEEEKNLYVKYKDDVEQITSTLPPSENVYQQALDQVRIKYSKQIVDEAVAARLAEVTEAAERQAVASAPRQAPVTLATTPAKAPAPASPSLTANQWADLQRQALVKGFEIGTAERLTADGLWAIERYKKFGRL